MSELARIRSVKPEITKDEALAECSRDARLTWIYMLPYADDEGRLRGSLKYLKAELFPYDDDMTLEKIDSILVELETAKGGIGFLRRYRVSDQSYLQILNFTSHQKINRPSPSKMPIPPETLLMEDSVRTHGGLSEGSVRDPDPDPEGIFLPTTTARARDPYESAKTAWASAGLERIPLLDDKERAAFYANFEIPRQKKGLTEEQISADASLFVEKTVASSIFKQRSFHSIMSKPADIARIMSGDLKDWSRVEKSKKSPEEILSEPMRGGGSGLRARAEAMRQLREQAGDDPVIDVFQIGPGGEE